MINKYQCPILLYLTTLYNRSKITSHPSVLPAISCDWFCNEGSKYENDGRLHCNH